MNDMDDQTLAVAARRDPAAFADLYRRHSPRVIAFAARRSRTGEEVADIAATVWLRAMENISTYNPDRGEFVTWLLGICANVHANWHRRSLREIQAVERYTTRAELGADDIARYDAVIDSSRLNTRLLTALELLSPDQRAVFDLVVVEDLAPIQAATALKISPVAARVRLSRAKAILRRALGDDAHPTTASLALSPPVVRRGTQPLR